MAEEIKKLLVALDFSELTPMVIENAGVVAKKINHSLEFLHIASSKSKKAESLKKLEEYAHSCEKTYGVKVECNVKEGSIYNSISDYANETKPTIVFMGTHGMKGIQKIFGSNALKVIVGSTVPFWVVQDKPKSEEIKSVLMPIDFTFESKEKLYFVKLLSYFYKFKVNIMTPNIKDSILRNKIKNNLIHIDKGLQERELEYEIIIGADKGDISVAVNNLASSLSTDLIIVTTTKHIGWNDYMFGAPEQKIIPNVSKIPVVCVNPRTDLTKFSSFR